MHKTEEAQMPDFGEKDYSFRVIREDKGAGEVRQCGSEDEKVTKIGFETIILFFVSLTSRR